VYSPHVNEYFMTAIENDSNIFRKRDPYH